MNGAAAMLDFAPVLPWPAVAVLGALALAVCAFAVLRGGRGTFLRAGVLALVVLALAGPRYVSEVRTPQDDVAVVVVDRSPSQAVGERRQRSDEALARVRERLEDAPGVELRVVEAGGATPAGGADQGTRLMDALAKAVGDVPDGRFAGAVLITDGEVHDIGAGTRDSLPDGPLHALITGERDTFDRRLVVEHAPSYGIVGQEVPFAFRVDTTAGQPRRAIPVTVTRGDEVVAQVSALPGRRMEVPVAIEHAGPTVVEIRAAEGEDELSALNNSAVSTVNGVRDRLRVLLVSGMPHNGERTWRNLLKSDPAVDLVHFTILRPPEKDDFTPIRELALITFPTFELFDLKLHEFDLIVFDRYVVRYVLPTRYFRNIRDFVRAGGAVMLAVGPEYAGQQSLYETPLGEILPARPTGNVLTEGFRPELTGVGRRHPVTAPLAGEGDAGEKPAWGRWFRQIESVPDGGEVLMDGMRNRPLLILKREGEGRVAVMTSDHIWLWARGFDGGGPQAEVVRRLAHWLMKEPALEEERLSAEVADGTLTVERHSLADIEPEATVTTPSGETRRMELTPAGGGLARGTMPAGELGVYRVEHGGLSARVGAGNLNPLEFADLRATDAIVGPLAQATGGGVWWLTDGAPDIRRTRPGRDTAGTDWLGLRENSAYVVTGLTEAPLLPAWLVMALAVAGLMGAWWREGR